MLYKVIPFFFFIGLFTWSNVTAISTEDTNTLIELHKAARDEIESSNMKDIRWDNDIANGAETYAKKCNDLKNSDYYAGELQGGDSNGNVTVIFNKWYSQKEYFEKCNCRANLKYVYNKKSIGQYAQIIYAQYDKFGCGKAKCDNLSYKYLLVCRYSVGISPGVTVYKLPSTTTPSSSTNNSAETSTNNNNSSDTTTNNNSSDTTTNNNNSDTTTNNNNSSSNDTTNNNNSSSNDTTNNNNSSSDNNKIETPIPDATKTTDDAKPADSTKPSSSTNDSNTPSNTNPETKPTTSSEETDGVKDIIFNNKIFNRIILLFSLFFIILL